MKRPRPPRIKEFPTPKQRLLDELLDKNSEGQISPEEKAKLAMLMAEAEELMVKNAKRLAEFAQKEAN